MLRNAARTSLLVFVVALVFAGCGPAPVPTRRGPPAPDGSTGAAAVVPDSAPEGGVVVIVRDAASAEAADAPLSSSDLMPTPVDAGREAATVDAEADLGTDAAAQEPPARAPRAAELVIDEILANPTGQDLGREWIEIANLAPERLDLSALHLADATTDVAVTAGTVEPGALLVLGQSLDPTKNGGVPVGATYGTHLILNNDNEQISLCLGPCATGVLLDQVTWGSVGASYDGHALIVDPVTKRICPATDPFGTAGDFGTPGQANPACEAPDASTDQVRDGPANLEIR